MDAEDKKKLDRILELAEENNKYIRKVRSVQKTAQMFKAIYWTIIIVFMLGGFIFIQPYLKTVMGVYSSIGGTEGGFQFSDAKTLESLYNQFRGEPKQ